VSVQSPSQNVSLARQAHVPPLQDWLPGQAFPHAPQWPGSLSGSTQLPLHGMNPASVVAESLKQQPLHTVSWCPHAAAHVPWLQIRPEPQTLPHAPQLAGSSESSRQTPEQNVSAGGQWQAPEMQICPAPQGRPHAPQLTGSLAVSVQPLAHAS
jgi:hypothetical protein